MRRELVAEVLDAASDELFEDVVYTRVTGGAAVTIEKAIFGVEPAVDRFEEFGQAMREASHTTRALKAKFPNLAKGDRINDGVSTYRVLDWQPTGDGRFEILIGLKPV